MWKLKQKEVIDVRPRLIRSRPSNVFSRFYKKETKKLDRLSKIFSNLRDKSIENVIDDLSSLSYRTIDNLYVQMTFTGNEQVFSTKGFLKAVKDLKKEDRKYLRPGCVDYPKDNFGDQIHNKLTAITKKIQIRKDEQYEDVIKTWYDSEVWKQSSPEDKIDDSGN